MHYIGFRKRFAAFIIDALLIVPPFAVAACISSGTLFWKHDPPFISPDWSRSQSPYSLLFSF